MEDTQNLAADAVPEQEIAAAPETVETETPNAEVEKAPEKTFTQAELDEIVAKRLSKERRKMERDIAAQVQQAQQPAPTGPITPDQFETWEDYAEALAEQKAREKIQQREVHQHVTQIEDTWQERVEKATEKYDDFEQVVIRNPNLPITPEMAATIKESEIGPEIAYWLGTNPKEAARIARLTPLQQAREIGKIEVKVASEPPVKKTTSAPAPITPVTARAATGKTYDTTDPRSTETMSVSEWIEADRKRLAQKQSQHR